MANTKKIVIEIVDKTQGNAGGETTPNPDDETPTGNKKSPSDDAAKKKTIFLTYALRKAKSVVTQAVESSINRYTTLKEDYMAENTLSAAKGIIGETVGFGATIFAGFKLGGAPGAAVAATAYAGSQVVNVINHFSEINQQINANNVNMQFQRTRMGLIDNGRGTEN